MIVILLLGFCIFSGGVILIFRHGWRDDDSRGSRYGHYAVITGCCLMAGIVSGANLVVAILTSVLGILWVAHLLVKSPKRPYMLTMGKQIFPLVAALWILRSFIVEPFFVPSSSMRPSLIPGDYVLTLKSIWGVRNPVSNEVLIKTRHPERGDIVVFRYPLDTDHNYVKRVIGLPGDHVSYRNHELFINGQKVRSDFLGMLTFKVDDENKTVTVSLTKQNHDGHTYVIAEDKNLQVVDTTFVMDFPFRENCHMDSQSFDCLVPNDHYFVLGDNRSYSEDSRNWGFLPDRLLVGKPFYLWFNLNSLERIGSI